MVSDAAAQHKLLEVKVFSSRETYFKGRATYLSATNATGTFDILPLHHSFITLLVPGVMKIGLEHSVEKQIIIKKALLRVRHNNVVVFIDV